MSGAATMVLHAPVGGRPRGEARLRLEQALRFISADFEAMAAATGLPVVTVPSADELREGGTRIDRVRDIQPEDVLGREPVKLDELAVSSLISGRAVMVTGAGGSIGSELCRQIARFGPSRIVLFELSEFALYQVEQDLGERFPHLPLVRLVGDVKDLAALRRAMATHQPDLVFHAAAYKHVPLMEDDNAWIALRNNTLGTYLAAQAAAEAKVKRFVLISTDKAVNPTNVMGATKRAAEMVVSHWATKAPGTRYMAVRFGNVLGSSGSVIPKFKSQIKKGGPVTVTDPNIVRYFMTIPEAAQLVLQAGALAQSGSIYVLDMGKPVKIMDLARQIIRFYGYEPDVNMPIRIVGLRPGEKLYEELLIGNNPQATSHPRIMKAHEKFIPWVVLESKLNALEVALNLNDSAIIRSMLQQLVPEYSPNKSIVDWVYLQQEDEARAMGIYN